MVAHHLPSASGKSKYRAGAGFARAANKAALGFSDRTARMLMKAAAKNVKPALHLDQPMAVRLSREMWGHKGEIVHVSANSGNNEWRTPAYILEPSRGVLGGFGSRHFCPGGANV